MSWIQTFDGAFFLTLGGMIFGFLGVAIKYCLKSKCQDFSCLWGMVKIIRRVDLESEIELEEYKTEHKIEDSKTEENKTILE
jgi:hypothetical protein